MDIKIIQGDCREVLATLPDRSVQTCVTSPPYFGLRNYGHDCQIGLEETPQQYVASLVHVFQQVRRVLRDDGTLWLVLGDSYMAQGGPQVTGTKQIEGSQDGAWGGRSRRAIGGLKPKDLIGIPWRMAFALQADGWYLRSDIIWKKNNPMPESVTDRPTKSHEYIFLLTKSKHYYYDANAIKEPTVSTHGSGNGYKRAARLSYSDENGARGNDEHYTPQDQRQRRSVWTVNTKSYKGAHFATFPPKLIEPCILAGAPVGGMVLDPFAGSGTTLAVAKEHGRHAIGIELNPDYIALAEKRLMAVQIRLMA